MFHKKHVHVCKIFFQNIQLSCREYSTQLHPTQLPRYEQFLSADSNSCNSQWKLRICDRNLYIYTNSLITTILFPTQKRSELQMGIEVANFRTWVRQCKNCSITFSMVELQSNSPSPSGTTMRALSINTVFVKCWATCTLDSSWYFT